MSAEVSQVLAPAALANRTARLRSMPSERPTARAPLKASPAAVVSATLTLNPLMCWISLSTIMALLAQLEEDDAGAALEEFFAELLGVDVAGALGSAHGVALGEQRLGFGLVGGENVDRVERLGEAFFGDGGWIEDDLDAVAMRGAGRGRR